MKTVWFSIIVLSLVPSGALAQSGIPRAYPTADPEVKPLPAVLSEPIPPGSLQAAPQLPVALAELEAMAQANNPTLAQAAARVEAARGQWVQVGLWSNPSGGYAAAEVGDNGTAGQQGGFVSQEVSMGGKLRLNRAVAAQEIRIAEQQFEAQRYRVLNDVRISFYDVLIAQRRVEISQQLGKVGEQALEAVDKFLRAKEASRVDLLQARIETSSAQILSQNAQNDYIAAWRRLAAVVGVPNLQPAPLNGDLQADIPEISFDDALHRLLATSPEMAAAQASVARAQKAVDRARAEPVPNVDLEAQVQHDNSTGFGMANIQIGLPVPVFNRNQGGIRRAQAELAAAQGDVQRLQLDLQNRLATVYQRFANTKQQVTEYRERILPDAQSSLEMVTNGYRQGEFGYLMLLTSQRTYFQTNLAYLESLRELRQSTVAIEGLLLTGSLENRD